MIFGMNGAVKVKIINNNNRDIWKYNEGRIDINFLIHVLNKNGNNLERIHKYKPYTPITKDITNIKRSSFNSKYV